MNGSTNNCSFTVTVNDTTKPTITCPANITTNACTAVVTFAPTVTDNCPGVTYSCTPASGSTFAQGTNTVTCTATDASGNTASASFKVMVTATAPGTVGTPTATAGTNQVVLTWPAISASAPITYSVSRSLSSGSGYSTIASGITALTYTNTGLTKGTKYYYYITATNCKGTSSSATVVNATSK
jgi:predicted phage tail protein